MRLNTIIIFIFLQLFNLTHATARHSSAANSMLENKGNQTVVEDAFAYSTTSGKFWIIGTKLIELTFEAHLNQFRLVSFKNKAGTQPKEYLSGTGINAFLTGSDDKSWAFKSAKSSKITSGGQVVVQLQIGLQRGDLLATVFVNAYPGTAVVRQWMELENVGNARLTIDSIPFSLPVSTAGGSVSQYWMVGGNSKLDQGLMKSDVVSGDYEKNIRGQATHDYMPWTAFYQNNGQKEGWFAALEYLGNWNLSVKKGKDSQWMLQAKIPDLCLVPLEPTAKVSLPAITLCTFAGGLDEMTVQSYNWQYRYMWDYTNMAYYAKPKWLGPWTYTAQNLQEQFAARLAYLDMNAEIMRTMGFKMLWDDAGWSSHNGMPPDNYGAVFTPTYEGPDFNQTRHFLDKMGMGWVAWFARRPSSGVMASKVGSWGNFEWRSDAVQFPDWEADKDWRDKILRFLDAYPGSSFHTCSGGSSYSHTFDIQKYANTNYFADLGRGPQTNYFFSYVEPPDKWVDIIEPWERGGAYHPATARQTLTMVPFWGLKATDESQELLRKDLDIYKYLLHKGVAGRWSYMFHPRIERDKEYYYAQRTSYDRLKACVIIKHQVPDSVVVFPVGLVPNHRYEISFDKNKLKSLRTGSDLMNNGIFLTKTLPGELIYIGLPDRPGASVDKIRPKAPANVLMHRETNIGYIGIGIYWSPGTDNNWVSYYEVKRGSEVLGKVSTGTNYFDRSGGWSTTADYSVRTVDGDGNVSEWVSSSVIPHEPMSASALGSLYEQRGREGWAADETTDGINFTPMRWIKPLKTSSADEGGTPNQPGGIEGWWEGEKGARLGRAWMQSSRKSAGVRTWIAPVAGKVRVVSRVMREWYRQSAGTPMRAKVLQGRKQVWPEKEWAIVPLNDLLGVTHDLVLDIEAGDSVRFVLDKADHPEIDIAAWMPRISYLPAKNLAVNEGVVRILCGAKQSYKDVSGNVWRKDTFFSGGKARPSVTTVEGGQDAKLYQFGRVGKKITYEIPAPKGLYTVRLLFAEPDFKTIYARPFNVHINGNEVLKNHDIGQDARGMRQAKDQVFRYVVPNQSGKIVLQLSGGFDPHQLSQEAIIQAIEVVPEVNEVVRLNCGSEIDFVDWNSFIWPKDGALAQGQTIKCAARVAQASPTQYDQSLYQTAISGREISYSIPVGPGLYSVQLKFAELWLKDMGQRKMDVFINGRRLWKSFDPAEAAGEAGMAIDLRAFDIAPDSKGNITIKIKALGQNDAILQGIQIL